MSILYSLLILAIGPLAPTEGRYPEATEIFACHFNPDCDQNFDGWPDGWSRRRSPEYPRYIPIRLFAEATPSGTHSLRIDLDGGAAVAYGPPIPASSLQDYVCEGLVVTEGLQYDRAWISLNFLDKDQQPLEMFSSAKVCETSGWKKLRLGPVSPKDHRVRSVVLGLHLEPQGQADLKGSARFDDLWLGRLPRLRLSAGRPLHVFSDPRDAVIRAEASGFTDRQTAVTFFLEDAWGKALATDRVPLEIASGSEDGHLKAETAGAAPPLVGSAVWRPPLAEPGFYRVCAAMPGRQSAAHRPASTLVVVDPLARSESGGEFGWSFPPGEHPLPLPERLELIVQAGLGRVKYPLWYDEKTFPAEIAKLLRLSSDLDAHGVELIGLLIPPESLWRRWGFRAAPTTAQAFRVESKVWYPSLEQTLARMAAQVRWWQIGPDRDTSLSDYASPADKAGEIKAELDRIGQDVGLGFGWSWSRSLPRAPKGKAPWRFFALSADPPLTPGKLAEALQATSDSGVQRWVVLEPQARGEHALEDRVGNLVQQMIVAKAHGAEGIFLAEPFDSRRGVMNDDGTPGELFLPWRTAAMLLNRAASLGSMELPQGSSNHLFAREDTVVMVIWNDTPQHENVYLGKEVQQVDVWGRRSVPAQSPQGQMVRVDRLPTFLVGVDASIAGWQRDCTFAKGQLRAVPGTWYDDVLNVKNPLDRTVAGKIRLAMPEGWQVEPPSIDFRLEAGRSLEQPLRLMLTDAAACGRQLVCVQYELDGDPPLRFGVQRWMEAALGDASVHVSTRLDASGELEVEQRIVNQAETPVSFRCRLYAPDRRCLTAQVIGLRGEDRKTYRLPDGKALVGKTLWLHLEELDGPRIWNHRFVVHE